MLMSKAKFVEVVNSLFELHPVDGEAKEYFEKVIKAKRVNSKDVEKSKVIKEAILKFLREYKGTGFDRVEIGNALYDGGEFPEEFLLNEKGEVAYNSITAYANQLVNDGSISKDEVKVGKTKRVKYVAG
jgi:hypothetical protein